MDELPDLARLSVAEKDQLIRELWPLRALVRQLSEQVATDHDVPFSNNVAEQAVRMPKVKQKISGGFRTLAGLESFCTIRSYLATLQKQGSNTFDALILAFKGNPPLPRFA